MFSQTAAVNDREDAAKVATSLADYEAAISSEYGSIRLAMENPAEPFQSSLESQSVGWMRLSRVFASAGFEGYRKNRASLGNREDLILMLVEDGRFFVDQHGRETVCESRSLVLMDCDSPMHALQLGPTRALAFRMPKAILRAHYSNINTGFARAVAASEGCAAILRDLMLSVWHHQDKLTLAESSRLPTSLLNLVGLVFLPGETEHKPRSHMAAQFRRIEKAIVPRLADPELSPASVAAELGISRSYLFAVMNSSGKTFRTLVMEQRLERCRQALADPGQASRSITDIALGWGFQSPSHFSRCFVDHYGISPTRYRDNVLVALQ